MRDWSLAMIAGLGSAALLAGALFFQYVIGLAPCELCIWQRWPHLAAVLIALLAFFVPRTIVMLAGALAVATTGAIGFYHTGVERGWFQGPQACSGGGDMSNLSAEQLLEQVMGAPIVRCNEVAWEMFGLSMASWNAILSFALAGLWLLTLRRAD